MRKLCILCVIALACIIIGLAFAEQMTFTTYYPAPAGVYRQFTTTSKTCLATNPLGTDIGLDPESMVGIGTMSPSTGGEQDLKLDVEGAVGAQYYCDKDGNNCVALPAQTCKMQRGTGQTKNNNCYTVTFPVAFAVGTTPSVMATPDFAPGYGPAGWPVAIQNITNLGFEACGQTYNDLYYYNWVAFDSSCFE